MEHWDFDKQRCDRPAVTFFWLMKDTLGVFTEPLLTEAFSLV